MKAACSRGLYLLVFLGLMAAPAGAATLLHMELGDLCGGADKIFRGTVVSFETGTVSVGGAELPTVIYRLRVAETFKGIFAEKDGVPFVELTLVGSPKTATPGELARLPVLPEPPQLQTGEEYLLFTTPPSAVGLSTTLGLGQGAFHVFEDGKRGEVALNEFDNLGVFADQPGMPVRGSVSYSALAAQIHQILGY